MTIERYTNATVTGTLTDKRPLYKSVGIAKGCAKVGWSDGGGRTVGTLAGGNLRSDWGRQVMRAAAVEAAMETSNEAGRAARDSI